MTSRIARPTANPAPPLSLMTSAPLPRVRAKRASAVPEVQPGNFSSGRPAGLRGRPDGDHAVAVLAEDRGRDLRRRELERLGDQAPEPGRVELRPQADHLRRGQAELHRGQVRQHVDGVGNDQDDRRLLRPGGLDLAQDVQEQLDVAVDQVEPALVGLAAEAGGDADEVALGDRLVAGRPDPLVGRDRRPVEEVERLPPAEVGVDVDQVDPADDPAALQGERGTRADQPAAADDADLHGALDFKFEISDLKSPMVDIRWPIRFFVGWAE